VVLSALLLGWAGARVTSLSGENRLSLPEAVLTVGTATAAQAEPASGFSHAGPQSYPDVPAPGLAYGPVPYPVQVQYVPVWYRDGAPRAYGPNAYYPNPRVRDGADRSLEDSSPHFFAEFPEHAPIPAVHREDSVLAAGLSSLFTGAPRPARYGEPAALLGGRLGRLIGNHARWSMDAWALIRKDGGKLPAAGTLPATYGASQAGSVLRYRLALNDARQPTAYLRTTSTLGGLTETSAALGLSAKPLPSVPIIAAVEGRLTQQSGHRRVQPAAMAVTAMPPLALPGALRAEIYAQGGYVAGRYATPFADGQVRVDRSVLHLGRAEARVGAGAWGGIQKGASRLDAGPGAVVSMPLTPKVFGRLAVDWRFRVGGNAEPDSGPALTVAAGF
jgi:hypothetical protein